MKRIAVVNQRYGDDVNGGSEVYARKLAEHLTKYYKVDFLTSDAFDYVTWKPQECADVEDKGGLTVRRFHVAGQRHPRWFEFFSRVRVHLGDFGAFLDEKWLRDQGPYVPDLVKYINDNRDNYDAFIFVTYLYYPVTAGIRGVLDKSVLVPTAHDEFCIYFPIFRRQFTDVAAIAYLTEEEKEFVEGLFHNEGIKNTVATMAVSLPEELHPDEFRKAHSLDRDYIIYAGRIDNSKGCDVMIRCFTDYISKHPESQLDLVLIGNRVMDIPESDRIHCLGFVSEQEKFDAMAGARLFWLPSEFESLSISTLECMALGKPGLVNGDCKVLKGHADKSGGVLAYSGDKECISALAQLDRLSSDRYDDLGRRCIAYVKRYYDTDNAEKEYVNLVEYVAQKNN